MVSTFLFINKNDKIRNTISAQSKVSAILFCDEIKLEIWSPLINQKLLSIPTPVKIGFDKA